MKSPKYTPSMSIAMTDREPIEVVAAFCGCSSLVSVRHRKQWKTIYEFGIENECCVTFLTEILPYLVCKRAQAEKTLALARLRSESRQHRTKVLGIHTNKAGHNAGHPYRVFGLSDDFINRCELLYQDALRGAPRSGIGKYLQRNI